MKKKFEVTQRFKTHAVDGSEIYVVELTTFGRLDHGVATDWVPVNKTFRTVDGHPVQLRADGIFVVVNTGARLSKA